MDQNARLALSLCKDIETTCADIYFFYAEVFAAQPAVRILWERVAFEEKNHANLLSMVLKLKDLEVAERQFDLPRIRNFVQIVQAVKAKIKTEQPQLLEALHSSLELEKKLQEFHLDCLVTFKNSSEEKLFAALQSGDQEHIAVLEKAYEAFLHTGEIGPA